LFGSKLSPPLLAVVVSMSTQVSPLIALLLDLSPKVDWQRKTSALEQFSSAYTSREHRTSSSELAQLNVFFASCLGDLRSSLIRAALDCLVNVSVEGSLIYSSFTSFSPRCLEHLSHLPFLFILFCPSHSSFFPSILPTPRFARRPHHAHTTDHKT
jgi:hypothetical protein